MPPELSSIVSSLGERSRNGALAGSGAEFSPAKTSGLAIRSATTADALVIARIHVETWRFAYRGIISAAHLDSLSIAQRTQGWEKNLRENRGHVLVAEMNGAVVGWVSFGPCRDEGEGHQAEIYALYIDLAHQRTGIGSTLLWFAEKQISPARAVLPARISLWVLARNESARRFYERLGYIAGPREKQELIGGEPLVELRYEKSLFQPGVSTR